MNNNSYDKALQIIRMRTKEAGIKDMLASGAGYLNRGFNKMVGLGRQGIDNLHGWWHYLKEDPRMQRKLKAIRKASKTLNDEFKLLTQNDIARAQAGIDTVDGLDRTYHAVNNDTEMKSGVKSILNAAKDIARTGNVKKYLNKGVDKAHGAVKARYPSIQDTEDAVNVLLNGPEKKSNYSLGSGIAKILLKQAMYKQADMVSLPDTATTKQYLDNAINMGKAVRPYVLGIESWNNFHPATIDRTGNLLGVPYMLSRGVRDTSDLLDSNTPTLDRERAGINLVNDAVGAFGPFARTRAQLNTVSPTAPNFALPAALTFDFAFNTTNKLNGIYADGPGNALDIYNQAMMHKYTDPNTGIVDPGYLENRTGINGTIEDMIDRGEIIATGATHDAFNHGKEIAKAGIDGYMEGAKRVGHAMNAGKSNPDIPHYYGTEEVQYDGVEPGYISRIQDPNGRVHFYDFWTAMKRPRDRGEYLFRLTTQPFTDIGYMLNHGLQATRDKRDAVGIQPKELAKKVIDNRAARQKAFIEDQKRKNKLMEETDRLMRR